MPTLDARLLGPFEVRADGEPVTVPGRNTRKVLVMLLDEANKPVQITGLVRGLWEDAELPDNPKKQIQNIVGEIRRAHPLLKDRLKTVSEDAYRFDIAETELDALRCKAAERDARALRDSGDLHGALARLQGALGEWRGPALAGMSGRLVESIARALDEDRLALLEQRFDVELALGEHHRLLGELRETVRRHPTRQRFAAQLMRALHASGRTGEALEFFEAVKARQVDALGYDPDRELREIHTRILRDDPEPAPAAAAAAAPPKPERVPFTLQAAPARFTGRGHELQRLDAALDASAGRAGLAVVSGMGGVGKTSLALQWAHKVAHRFPDGCFYFDLRGFDPLAPETGSGPALGKALRRLGVDQHHLPGDLEDQADLYRTMLAGRRVLIVLDNARDAQQVRPLLPASADSFTVVTSRNRLMGLIGLDGATPVPLGVLTDEESTAVLGRFVADDLAESRAARRIVAVCAGLPLALCLAGAWAAANPDLPLSSLADRLESTGNVLRVLSSDDPTSDPRTVFSCSYQELGARARQAFRLLGLHPGPDVTAAALASLAAVPLRQAEETLRELATVQLVHEHRPGRFVMHDLLRVFAAERLEAESTADDRSQASRRMLEHYLYSVDRADRLLASYRERLDFGGPSPDVTPEAIEGLRGARDWLAAEYPVLMALVRLDVEPAHDRLLWRLAWCLVEYIMVRHRGQDMIDCQSAALAAARRSRDAFAEIVSLGYLAAGLFYIDDRDASLVRLDRAMDLAEEHGMPWAKGFVLYGLGVSAARADRDADAIDYGKRAREHFREAGDATWEMRSEHVIGWHSARIGALAEARVCFERMLSFGQATGVAVAEATARFGLGYIAHRERRFEEALEYYGKAVGMYCEHGMEPTAAFVMEHVGDIRLATGEPAEARAEWARARRLYLAYEVTADVDRVQRKLDESELGALAFEHGAQQRVDARLAGVGARFGHAGHPEEAVDAVHVHQQDRDVLVEVGGAGARRPRHGGLGERRGAAVDLGLGERRLAHFEALGAAEGEAHGPRLHRRGRAAGQVGRVVREVRGVDQADLQVRDPRAGVGDVVGVRVAAEPAGEAGAVVELPRAARQGRHRAQGRDGQAVVGQGRLAAVAPVVGRLAVLVGVLLGGLAGVVARGGGGLVVAASQEEVAGGAAADHEDEDHDDEHGRARAALARRLHRRRAVLPVLPVGVGVRRRLRPVPGLGGVALVRRGVPALAHVGLGVLGRLLTVARAGLSGRVAVCGRLAVLLGLPVRVARLALRGVCHVRNRNRLFPHVQSPVAPEPRPLQVIAYNFH